MIPIFAAGAVLAGAAYLYRFRRSGRINEPSSNGEPSSSGESPPSGESSSSGELSSSTEPIVPEESQLYTHPFIPLLVAWSMTFEAFTGWLRFMCMENTKVAQATKGKARDIWNTMLGPFLASLAANDGDDPRVVFMHETGGEMEPDGVVVEWLNNRAVQLADVWSAIAYIVSVAASFDDRERTKDWYLELLIVFSILLRKIALSSSNTVEAPYA
ncbi:hypothetical protein FRC01_010493, partial [Tulasnella sp. 417]